MAACRSLQHMFENPLPESPTTLVESPYSWNQIKSVKPIEQSSSFTEIFGELHFKENSSSSSSSVSSCLVPMASSSSSSSSSCLTDHKKSPSSISMEDSFSSLTKTKYGISCHRNSSDSFSSLLMNSESLQLCTEGLGFESSGEVEEDLTTKDKDKDKDMDMDKDMDKDYHSTIIKEDGDDCQLEQKLTSTTTTTTTTTTPCSKGHHLSFQRSSSRSSININGNGSSSSSSSSSGSGSGSGSGTGTFPPPISCISKNGKPWVCFKSYRHDGRFVLKQIRIPTQEFLHACREDGRLKLHFVHPHHHHHQYDGILEDQQYDHQDDDDEEGDYDDDDDDHQEYGKQEDNIDESELVPVRR